MYGLKNTAHQAAALQQKAKALGALQRTMTHLSQDLANIAPRSIDDENHLSLPPLLGKKDYLEISTFEGAQVARHAYFLDNKRLILRVFDTLDRFFPEDQHKNKIFYKDTVLLDSLDSLAFGYIDDKKNLLTQWPPLDISTTSFLEPGYPLIIKLTLTDSQEGTFERFFVIQKLPSLH